MARRPIDNQAWAETRYLRAGLSAFLLATALTPLSGTVLHAQETDNLGGTDAEASYLLRRAETDAGNSPGAIATSDYRVSGDAADDDEPLGPEISFETDDPLTTGSVARGVDPKTGEKAKEEPVSYRRARGLQPAEPVQSGPDIKDVDAYAPTGMDIGSFVLRPSIEIGTSYTRDVSASDNGTGGIDETTSTDLLGDTTLRLKLDSDWDRHALAVDAYGRFQRSLKNGNDAWDPEAGIDATVRIDITKRTTLTGTFGYSYLQDDPQSAAFYAATDPAALPALTGTNEPGTQSVDGALTLRHETNSVFGEAEISAGRTIYGTAELSDGSTLTQNDLNNNLYGGRLRAGLAISPVLSPFVEGEYGLRRMDRTPDSGGVNRNARLYALRAGTEVNFGEKLNGELALGYVVEDVEDSALADIAGVAVDASVNWSPQRGTDVALNLATTTESGTDAASSGAVVYAAGLGVTHQLRSNLTANVLFGAQYRDVVGAVDETTLSAEAGVTYWLNRFAGVTTRLRHEQTMSADPLEREQSSSAFVGIKLQR